jgi:predicted ATPase
MIKRITIKDFKSLADVSVDLEPVTVLVGRSGTGKSNFVNALRFLRNYVLLGEQAAGERVLWPHVVPAGRDKPAMSFEVRFEVARVRDDFTYLLAFVSQQRERQRFNEERLCLGGEVLFHQKAGEWLTEPKLVDVPPPDGPMIGKIPAISDIGIAYTALTTGIGCHDFPMDVLTTSQSLPSERLGSGASHQLNGLHDDGENSLVVLQALVNDLQDLSIRRNITAALQQINASVATVELNSMQKPTSIVVGHDFEGRTLLLPLDAESDGFRRFYAHLLALYQQPPKQTLIFEEPENGIYPGALSLLADEFKAAPEARRGQVILTTHSPGLLDHFPPEALRVVELDNHQTRIGPVDSDQSSALKDNLLNAGELLTVDPARMQTAGAPEA